jgi:hypothetical protein
MSQLMQRNSEKYFMNNNTFWGSFHRICIVFSGIDFSFKFIGSHNPFIMSVGLLSWRWTQEVRNKYWYVSTGIVWHHISYTPSKFHPSLHSVSYRMEGVIWGVTVCIRVEGGGWMFLKNAGNHLPDNMVS